MTSSLMIFRRKKKPQASAVVLRKYRRLRRRRGGLKREYKKLKALLPEKTKAIQLKKVGVVEAAYRYICQLQDALLDKFSSNGVPEDLAGVVCGKVTSSSDIQALALHLIKTSSSSDYSGLSWPVSGVKEVPFRLPSQSGLPSSSSSSSSISSSSSSFSSISSSSSSISSSSSSSSHVACPNHHPGTFEAVPCTSSSPSTSTNTSHHVPANLFQIPAPSFQNPKTHFQISAVSLPVVLPKKATS